MSLQIEEQDDRQLRGHGSISGSTLSCKGSQVTLSPDSKNRYFVVFSGGGCNGEGKLKYQGDTLKGKIKFQNVGTTGQTVSLVKHPVTSVMMGNWKDQVHFDSAGGGPLDMSLQIQEQDAQVFLGYASISGDILFCKGSRATLTSDSGNNYSVVITEGGCSGNGKFSYEGDTLKGKVKFDGIQRSAKAVKLTKSE